MTNTFLKSLEKPQINPTKIFNKLYQGVVETNKLIGIGLGDLTLEGHKSLIKTYGKLREEEVKEVQEALVSEDRDNLVKELLDVLVVSGYEYYLKTGSVFYEPTKPCINLQEDIKWLLWNQEYYEGNINLENILIFSQKVLQSLNINLEYTVGAVLNENLSKFPTLEELESRYFEVYDGSAYDSCILWQCALLESERYQGIFCKEVIDSEGDARLTFWCNQEYGKEKLKYLKPISYKKCNLSSAWLD